MSKNIRINLIYSLLWIVSIVILIGVGFVMDNVLGYLIYIGVTIVCGVIALWQKHRLNVWWVWAILWFSGGFGFPIAVLFLKTKGRKRPIKRIPDAQGAVNV